MTCLDLERGRVRNIGARYNLMGFVPNPKRGKAEIVGALTEIFSLLLAMGQVLELWRIANVFPSSQRAERKSLETTG